MPLQSGIRLPRSRRGALLLIVLSMLTLFLMIGSLLLVLAARSRTAARAFAAANSPDEEAAIGPSLLEEALMLLIRGEPPAANDEDKSPLTESLLADKYGLNSVQGSLTGISADGRIATIPGLQTPPDGWAGRVVTFRPVIGDPAPITSYRIVEANGNQFTIEPMEGAAERRLPSRPGCAAIINGREFIDEPYDSPDEDNPFLTGIPPAPQGNDPPAPVKPAFAPAPPAGGGTATPVANQVDNDGDGVLDGIWLSDVLPDRLSPKGGTISYRVSYLVIDLDGRLNVNAHGPATGAPPSRRGPADIDAKKLLADSWDRLQEGGIPPDGGGPPQQGEPRSRRPALKLPSVTGLAPKPVQGATAEPVPVYERRLRANGPRLMQLEAAQVGSLFGAAELECVLRPYDRDAMALPQRLVALLGSADLEKARSSLTTDSWDSSALAAELEGDQPTDDLPEDVRRGLKFDLNRKLTSDEEKEAYFQDLRALALRLIADTPPPAAPPPNAAERPTEAEIEQWVANVIDFLDEDKTAYEWDPEDPDKQGVEWSLLDARQKDMVPGTANTWDRGHFDSTADLLGIPYLSKAELKDLSDKAHPAPPPEVFSLFKKLPKLFEWVTVPSPFNEVAIDPVAARWREPGRINLNTCSADVRAAFPLAVPASAPQATAIETTASLLRVGLARNPAPAQQQDDGDSERLDQEFFQNTSLADFDALRADANALLTTATIRSNVFAVWISLETRDSSPNSSPPTVQRLFAIVDRSVPVGFLPGVDLNARDTVRLVRFLE